MNKVKAFPITPFETYLEMTQYGTEVHFEHDKYELLSGVYEDNKMYFLIDYHTGLTYEVEQKIADTLLDLNAEGKGDELVKEITPRLHSSSNLSYS